MLSFNDEAAFSEKIDSGRAPNDLYNPYWDHFQFYYQEGAFRLEQYIIRPQAVWKNNTGKDVSGTGRTGKIF